MGEWNAVHGMYAVRKNKKSWATAWVAAQWQFGDDVGTVWANYSIIHSDGVVSKPWLSNAQGIWHEYVVDFKCIGESRQRCSIHPHATATCYMDLRKECWCVSMGVTMVRNHIPFHAASFFMCHSTPPNLLQMSTASKWEALRNTCFVLGRFEEFEYLQVNSNSLLSPGIFRRCGQIVMLGNGVLKCGRLGMSQRTGLWHNIRNMKRTVCVVEATYQNGNSTIVAIITSTIVFKQFDLIQ